MVLDNTGKGENISESTVQSRALGRLNGLKLFAYALFKYCGLFLLGIFVGMGIVLKNPPSNKELLDQIKKYEVERNATSHSLVVKDSVAFN